MLHGEAFYPFVFLQDIHQARDIAFQRIKDNAEINVAIIVHDAVAQA